MIRILTAVCFSSLLVLALDAQDPKSTPPSTDPPYWTHQDLLDKKIPQTYAVRPGHPRLLITKETQADLLEKAKAAPRLWARVIAEAERSQGISAVLACGAVYQLGLVPGVKHALSREDYGKRGVEELMKLASTPNLKLVATSETFIALPCGYDWLFDLLSAEQKKTLADRLAQAAEEFKQGPCTIGGQEMVFGLAFAGDGVADAKAQAILDKQWKAWWDPQSKAKNLASLLLYSQDSGHSDSYLQCRFAIYPMAAAWKTATGQDYFAKLGYFRRFPYYMAHMALLRPPKNSPGKAQAFEVPLHMYKASYIPRGTSLPMAAAATGYLRGVDDRGASLARWWIDQTGDFETLPHMPLLYGFLLGDPRVKGRSPEELAVPRSFLFGGGVNTAYARSSWSDPDATVTALSNQRFPDTRVQRSANAWTLWKNSGPLFPYRGNICYHYYIGPEEPFANAVEFYKGTSLLSWNHWGTQAPGGSMAVGKEIGSLTSASEPGAYEFMRSEVAARIKGVAKCERSVVWFPGKTDFVVLLDRVRTDEKALAPHVVFQTVFEPKVGRDWEGQEQGTPVVEGQWRLRGAPCVTVTHEHAPSKSHGRAFLKVLSPGNAEILKIGGEKHFADSLAGKPPRESNYKGFVSADRDTQIDSGGYWRFHVVTEDSSGEVPFLTAIEATDSSQRAPAGPLELLPGESFLAARAGPNVVLFSKRGGVLDSGSVHVPAEGLRSVVVADLRPQSEYAVTVGGKAVASGKTSAAGTLLVQASPWPAGGVLEVRRKP